MTSTESSNYQSMNRKPAQAMSMNRRRVLSSRRGFPRHMLTSRTGTHQSRLEWTRATGANSNGPEQTEADQSGLERIVFPLGFRHLGFSSPRFPHWVPIPLGSSLALQPHALQQQTLQRALLPRDLLTLPTNNSLPHLWDCLYNSQPMFYISPDVRHAAVDNKLANAISIK